jgi:archaemetzincin
MADIINIIPLSNINKDILEYLQDSLGKIFKKETRVLYRISIPDDSYDQSIKQHNAESILDHLSKKLSLKNIRDINIAVLDLDIFVPRLNFVFGLAVNFPRICLISTARLNPLFYSDLKSRPRWKSRVIYLSKEDRKIFNERILKEAVHEIGHTLGLGHCPDYKCVMYFSNTLLDTDKKSSNFCTNCKNLLKKSNPFI